MRRLVSSRVAERGLKIVAAGTHPFSQWEQQEITPLERYAGLREDLQTVAERNLIFGTHVHVGIEDREFLIDAMNVSRYFLPHVLALSTSSGRPSGPVRTRAGTSSEGASFRPVRHTTSGENSRHCSVRRRSLEWPASATTR